MSELEEFLGLNNISEETLLDDLHLDIRETILRIICDRLKKDQAFYTWAKKVFFMKNDIVATRKIIDRACGCKLSEKDTLWMQTCIKAFFSKGSTRQPTTQEEKEHLLKKQNGKCAICGCPISINTMHVDHIIPWDYVGDNLNDNSQGLCKGCNLSKSNHVAQTVTNLILYRGQAQ